MLYWPGYDTSVVQLLNLLICLQAENQLKKFIKIPSTRLCKLCSFIMVEHREWLQIELDFMALLAQDSWAVSMTDPGITVLYWGQLSHITGCLERSVWADYRLYFWYLESWNGLVQCWCIINIQRHQNPLEKDRLSIMMKLLLLHMILFLDPIHMYLGVNVFHQCGHFYLVYFV